MPIDDNQAIVLRKEVHGAVSVVLLHRDGRTIHNTTVIGEQIDFADHAEFDTDDQCTDALRQVVADMTAVGYQRIN